jgi:hypothetical protein
MSKVFSVPCICGQSVNVQDVMLQSGDGDEIATISVYHHNCDVDKITFKPGLGFLMKDAAPVPHPSDYELMMIAFREHHGAMLDYETKEERDMWLGWLGTFVFGWQAHAKSVKP